MFIGDPRKKIYMEAMADKAMKDEAELQRLKKELAAATREMHRLELLVKNAERSYQSTLAAMQEIEDDKLLVKGVSGLTQSMHAPPASILLPVRPSDPGKRGRKSLGSDDEIAIYLKPILLGNEWKTVEEIRKLVADRFKMTESTAGTKLPRILRQLKVERGGKGGSLVRIPLVKTGPRTPQEQAEYDRILRQEKEAYYATRR